MVGINRSGFEAIFNKFKDFYVVKSGPKKRGRPTRLVDKRMALGLILCFYRNSIKYRVLGSWFGVPSSTLSRVVIKAEIALYRALPLVKEARICWPSLENQKHWDVSLTEPFR